MAWTSPRGMAAAPRVRSAVSAFSETAAGVRPATGTGPAVVTAVRNRTRSCPTARGRTGADRVAVCSGRPWKRTTMSKLSGPVAGERKSKTADVLASDDLVGSSTGWDWGAGHTDEVTSTSRSATGCVVSGSGKSRLVTTSPRTGTAIRTSRARSASGGTTRRHSVSPSHTAAIRRRELGGGPSSSGAIAARSPWSSMMVSSASTVPARWVTARAPWSSPSKVTDWIRCLRSASTGSRRDTSSAQ